MILGVRIDKGRKESVLEKARMVRILTVQRVFDGKGTISSVLIDGKKKTWIQRQAVV